MRSWIWILWTGGLLAAAAAPSLAAADDAELAFTLEVLGTSPAGDAVVLRRRYHPPPPAACPATAYPPLHGQCTAALTLYVCRTDASQCESFEVYDPFDSIERRTPEAESQKRLAQAKQAAAKLGVPLRDEGAELAEAKVPPGLLAADGFPGVALASGEDEVLSVKSGDLTVPLARLGFAMPGEEVTLTTLVARDRSLLVFIGHSGGVSDSVLALRRERLAARLLTLRGHARYAKRDWAGAAQQYAAAVERAPELATARIALGLAQLRLGKRDEALATLQRALRAPVRADLEAPLVLEPSVAAFP